MSSGTRHSRRRPGAPAVLRPASVRSRVLAAVLDTVLAVVLVGGTALGLMAVGRPVLVGCNCATADGKCNKMDK